MKRKRQSNSPKVSQASSANTTGNASSFLNKNPHIFKQTRDFQKLGKELIQILNAVIDKRIEQNTLLHNFSSEMFTPSITISSTAQALNLNSNNNYKISSQIGCLKPEFINEIHAIFHNYALTRTTAESFIPHFLGGVTTARKIIWIRGINLLTFTFTHLMEKLFPYYDEPFKIIAEHFCDKKGNDLTTDQLRKNHSKKVQKESKQNMILSAFLPLIKKVDAK